MANFSDTDVQVRYYTDLSTSSWCLGIGIAVSGGVVVQQVLLSFGRVARELMLPARSPELHHRSRTKQASLTHLTLLACQLAPPYVSYVPYNGWLVIIISIH